MERLCPCDTELSVALDGVPFLVFVLGYAVEPVDADIADILVSSCALFQASVPFAIVSVVLVLRRFDAAFLGALVEERPELHESP